MKDVNVIMFDEKNNRFFPKWSLLFLAPDKKNICIGFISDAVNRGLLTIRVLHLDIGHFYYLAKRIFVLTIASKAMHQTSTFSKNQSIN